MVDVYGFNIVPDILKHFKVKDVIIDGLTDKNLIDEILEYDAQPTVISNSNPHDFDLEIIGDNSLNVLPNLSDYDAIFINDDPNWYTVFNQLNIIKNTNEEFPLVFVCNNRFPHKRRDSYSNPYDIPEEFRQEFTRELPLNFNGEKILIQDSFYHATIENSIKNGVFTAIEDFLNQNSEISIMNLKFLEEITILYPKSTISQIRIDKIMRDIKHKVVSDLDLYSSKFENKILLSYIYENNVSVNDLKKIDDLKIEISEKNELIDIFENKIKVHDDEIEYKNSRIGGVESQLNLKNSQIRNLESKLINKNVEIENLNNQISTLENKINESESHLLTEEFVKNKFDDRIHVIQEVFNSFENQLDDLIEDNESTYIKLKDANIALKSTEKKLDNNQKSISSLKNENTKLNRKLHTNEYCISCFKEEISNNKVEINYLKNNGFIKRILSPLSYLILLFKSNPHELFLNIKLYKSLKDSNCFDVGYYLKNNVDLIRSSWYKYFSPELHYVCNGFNENRRFNKKYFNCQSKKSLLNYLSKCEEQ